MLLHEKERANWQIDSPEREATRDSIQRKCRTPENQKSPMTPATIATVATHEPVEEWRTHTIPTPITARRTIPPQPSACPDAPRIPLNASSLDLELWFIAMLCSVPQSPHPSNPLPQQQTHKYPHPSRSSPLHQAVQANRTSHSPPPTKPRPNQPISNLKSPPPARDREPPYSRSPKTPPPNQCAAGSGLLGASQLSLRTECAYPPSPNTPPTNPRPADLPPAPSPTPHELCRMRGCTPVALTRPPT